MADPLGPDRRAAATVRDMHIRLEGVIRRTPDGRLGAEDASAAITTVFLAGAGPR
jgi:hypothetical protein